MCLLLCVPFSAFTGHTRGTEGGHRPRKTPPLSLQSFGNRESGPGADTVTFSLEIQFLFVKSLNHSVFFVGPD